MLRLGRWPVVKVLAREAWGRTYLDPQHHIKSWMWCIPVILALERWRGERGACWPASGTTSPAPASLRDPGSKNMVEGASEVMVRVLQDVSWPQILEGTGNFAGQMVLKCQYNTGKDSNSHLSWPFWSQPVTSSLVSRLFKQASGSPL